MIVATFLLMWFAFSGLIVTRGTVSTCVPFFDIRQGVESQAMVQL